MEQGLKLFPRTFCQAIRDALRAVVELRATSFVNRPRQFLLRGTAQLEILEILPK